MSVCVDATLGYDVKGDRNSVGENSAQFCANPCTPFMTQILTFPHEVSCPCAT